MRHFCQTKRSSWITRTNGSILWRKKTETLRDMESRERRNHLTDFCNKYIEYLEHEYGRSPQTFYDFFDTFVFPKECDRLGFRMDSGESFIEKIHSFFILSLFHACIPSIFQFYLLSIRWQKFGDIG